MSGVAATTPREQSLGGRRYQTTAPPLGTMAERAAGSFVANGLRQGSIFGERQKWKAALN